MLGRTLRSMSLRRVVGHRMAARGWVAHASADATRQMRPLSVRFASSTVDGADGPNPLWPVPDGLFDYGAIKADHVEGAVGLALEAYEAGIAGLEAAVRCPDHADRSTADRARHLTDSLETAEDSLGRVWGVVGHLHRVVNTPELREAHAAVQPRVTQATTLAVQSRPLYEEVVAITDAPDFDATVDDARRRVLMSRRLAAEQTGVGLTDEAQLARFNEIKTELATLQTKFSNNVVDATAAWELIVTDPADVEGMPQPVLQMARQSAKDNGHKEGSAEAGPWRFTLDFPSYVPLVTHCRNRDLREAAVRAYSARASSFTPDFDNEGIITDVLKLREEFSHMLGYANFGEVSLATKMADGVAAVDDLVAGLRDRCYPVAKAELQELQTFANANGHDGPLENWDTTFWAERHKEATFGLNEQELRAYFPLDAVLEGLFTLCHRLFNINVEVDTSVEGWHPDVQFYRVSRADTGAPMAGFFLDPYARSGQKLSGAWMDDCLGRSEVLAPEGASARLPVAYLVCNFTPPVEGRASHLLFSEVTTLAHELGHGLQHMLTTVGVGGAAGISNVEWDAVEVASQFMEHWCLEPATLDVMTRHEETGATIPRDLIDKLNAAKHHMAASAMLRQCFFSKLDMALHTAPAAELDPLALQDTIAKEYTVLPPLEDNRFLCSFLHIFAGGYSAGYYSYKYAEVMAADAFAAFTEAGPEKEAEVGAAYRDTLLALGGSQHPADVFRSFRGRDPSIDPLLQLYGLDTAPN